MAPEMQFRPSDPRPEAESRGDENATAPMTGAQAARLRVLAEEAYEPEAYRSRLTAGEAARRIGVLQAKLVLFDGPPHTA